MPLFTEVLSAIDLIKNTYTSNKRLNEKETFFRFFSFLFLIFFVGKQHGQKIRVLAFIKKRGVLLLRLSEH